jgi:succinoglycan biosynthesis transport protein ExoP
VEHAQIAPRRTSLYSIEKENGDFSAQFSPQGKDEARADFSVYLNVMRRRKWFIIAPLIIVLPLVIIGLLLQKPIYEATATLLIDSGSSKIVNIEDVLQTDRSREYYETQLKLIMSPVLAERVIDILESQNENVSSQNQSKPNSSINAVSNFPGKVLHLVKEKLVGHKYDNTLNPAEIARHEKIVAFQKSLKVDPVMGTRLVEITMEGPRPSLVAAQANTLADAYLEQHLEKKSEASRKASVWLTKEIPDLREKLQHAEMALQGFLDSRGLTPADLEGKPASWASARLRTCPCGVACC